MTVSRFFARLLSRLRVRANPEPQAEEQESIADLLERLSHRDAEGRPETPEARRLRQHNEAMFSRVFEASVDCYTPKAEELLTAINTLPKLESPSNSVH